MQIEMGGASSITTRASSTAAAGADFKFQSYIIPRAIIAIILLYFIHQIAGGYSFYHLRKPHLEHELESATYNCEHNCKGTLQQMGTEHAAHCGKICALAHKLEHSSLHQIVFAEMWGVMGFCGFNAPCEQVMHKLVGNWLQLTASLCLIFVIVALIHNIIHILRNADQKKIKEN